MSILSIIKTIGNWLGPTTKKVLGTIGNLGLTSLGGIGYVVGKGLLDSYLSNYIQDYNNKI